MLAYMSDPFSRPYYVPQGPTGQAIGHQGVPILYQQPQQQQQLHPGPPVGPLPPPQQMPGPLHIPHSTTQPLGLQPSVYHQFDQNQIYQLYQNSTPRPPLVTMPAPGHPGPPGPPQQQQQSQNQQILKSQQPLYPPNQSPRPNHGASNNQGPNSQTPNSQTLPGPQGPQGPHHGPSMGPPNVLHIVGSQQSPPAPLFQPNRSPSAKSPSPPISPHSSYSGPRKDLVTIPPPQPQPQEPNARLPSVSSLLAAAGPLQPPSPSVQQFQQPVFQPPQSFQQPNQHQQPPPQQSQQPPQPVLHPQPPHLQPLQPQPLLQQPIAQQQQHQQHQPQMQHAPTPSHNHLMNHKSSIGQPSSPHPPLTVGSPYYNSRHRSGGALITPQQQQHPQPARPPQQPVPHEQPLLHQPHPQPSQPLQHPPPHGHMPQMPLQPLNYGPLHPQMQPSPGPPPQYYGSYPPLYNVPPTPPPYDAGALYPQQMIAQQQPIPGPHGPMGVVQGVSMQQCPVISHGVQMGQALPPPPPQSQLQGHIMGGQQHQALAYRPGIQPALRPLDQQQSAMCRVVKPKRKRATSHQVNRLNEVFAQTFFPSSELRLSLALDLGMTPRTVQIWFQNKRQGWRSEHNKSVSRNMNREISELNAAQEAAMKEEQEEGIGAGVDESGGVIVEEPESKDDEVTSPAERRKPSSASTDGIKISEVVQEKITEAPPNRVEPKSRNEDQPNHEFTVQKTSPRPV